MIVLLVYILEPKPIIVTEYKHLVENTSRHLLIIICVSYETVEVIVFIARYIGFRPLEAAV